MGGQYKKLFASLGFARFFFLNGSNDLVIQFVKQSRGKKKLNCSRSSLDLRSYKERIDVNNANGLRIAFLMDNLLRMIYCGT